MNKIFLGLFGGVIIVVIGAMFLVTQNDKKQATVVFDDLDIEDVTELDELISFDGSGTIKELLEFGKNIICDISYVFDANGNQYSTGEYGGSLEGTVYVAGDNFRADLLMITNDGFMESSVIHTDSKGYTWGTTPLGEIAIMFDIEESATEGSQEPSEVFGADENVTYDCRGWGVDPTKFIPPSDITFVDFATSIESQLQIDGASVQCGSCDQIPDETAKAQCRSALQCN